MINRQVPPHLLDTSALIAWFQREPGWEEVRRLIDAASDSRLDLCISFMTVMECFYRSWQISGQHAAFSRTLHLRNLPLQEIPPNDAILFEAGRLKAQHRLSLADAWIAGTAIVIGATLVHKDPEFDALAGELAMQRLPAA